MCRDLRNRVNRWVKGDSDIVHHTIATFGVECDCTGKELFDSIKLCIIYILMKREVNSREDGDRVRSQDDLRAARCD